MGLRDPIASASHLLTALWAAYATLILLRLAPPGRRWPVAVYGLSMVMLYTASGAFHGLPYTKLENPDEFRFFQKIDQSCIYLLIVGTNTPCLAVLLGGRRAKWFLSLMWGLAFVGIGCLWLMPKMPHELTVGLYLGIGWLGVAPIAQYYRKLGWRAMNWLWLGAGLYTIGAVFELAEWPMISPGPIRFGYHEILHLCDTAATMVFFVFISRHVVGFQPRAGEPDRTRLAA
jgi:hemolysin III